MGGAVLLEQPRQEGVQAVDDAHEVDVDQAPPVLERRVRDRPGDGDAGVEEQQVERAGGQHPVGQRLHGVGVGDVDLVRRAGAAGRVDLGGHARRAVGVAVDDVHRRAAAGALERERAADARGRAGDDDGAALQVVDARVGAALQTVGGDGREADRGGGGEQAREGHGVSLAGPRPPRTPDGSSGRCPSRPARAVLPVAADVPAAVQAWAGGGAPGGRRACRPGGRSGHSRRRGQTFPLRPSGGHQDLPLLPTLRTGRPAPARRRRPAPAAKGASHAQQHPSVEEHVGRPVSRRSGSAAVTTHPRRRPVRRRGCAGHLVVAPLWVAYRTNLGTLLRTCDAVGACLAAPPTRHHRASLDQGDTLPWRPCVHWTTPTSGQWLARQRADGARVLAVELAEGATRLADLAPARQPTVVLLGDEGRGLPDEAWTHVDETVEIPMVGVGRSLNVAVAGSLVLYRLAGLG